MAAALEQAKVCSDPDMALSTFPRQRLFFININIAVDFCVRQVYDQICAYARFTNEAPGQFMDIFTAQWWTFIPVPPFGEPVSVWSPLNQQSYHWNFYSPTRTQRCTPICHSLYPTLTSQLRRLSRPSRKTKAGAKRHRVTPPVYVCRQKIWLSTKDLPFRVACNKLAPRLTGLYQITRVMSYS